MSVTIGGCAAATTSPHRFGHRHNFPVLKYQYADGAHEIVEKNHHLERGIWSAGGRTFAAGDAEKKGFKGGAGDGPKASLISKEVKSTTVFGTNILKEGQDPKILSDSEYPDWLCHLLGKCPALSELRRKNIQSLPYEDLNRFVKLDNRARIKENNILEVNDIQRK